MNMKIERFEVSCTYFDNRITRTFFFPLVRFLLLFLSLERTHIVCRSCIRVTCTRYVFASLPWYRVDTVPTYVHFAYIILRSAIVATVFRVTRDFCTYSCKKVILHAKQIDPPTRTFYEIYETSTPVGTAIYIQKFRSAKKKVETSCKSRQFSRATRTWISKTIWINLRFEFSK